MKMLLRKLGIPVVALAGMLALFNPTSADARVRFGVAIGAPPYPVAAYPYPYYDPYYGYPYGYVAPSWGYGWHYDGHHFDRHEHVGHHHDRR